MFSAPDSGPKEEQKPLAQESTPTKPVQSVAPQARDSSSSSVWEPGTDSLVDLWDSSSNPPPNPSQTSQSSNLVDLMGDALRGDVPPGIAAASGKPQPLLSFDEMIDGTFCSGAEDEPTSLVDMTAPDQMTLSYQHALQHASGEEMDDGQLLMTNGETLLKEGTQVRQVHAAGLKANLSVFLLVQQMSSACFYRRVRAISANHRRKNLANQRSPQLNPHLSFITSHQVRSLKSTVTSETSTADLIVLALLSPSCKHFLHAHLLSR